MARSAAESSASARGTAVGLTSILNRGQFLNLLFAKAIIPLRENKTKTTRSTLEQIQHKFDGCRWTRQKWLCHADNPSPFFLIFENKISAMAYHFAHTAGYHIFQQLLATRVKYSMTIISKFAD